MATTQQEMERMLEGGNTEGAKALASGAVPRTNFGNNMLPTDAGMPQATVEQQQTQAPEPQQQQPNVETEVKPIKLPDGRTITARIPVGISKKELYGRLVDAGVIADPVRGRQYALERFKYEWGTTDNITTNTGRFMKSHFPYLATEYQLDEDGNLQIKTADEIYGEDFDSLSPQERRDRIKQVDQQRLMQKYSRGVNEAASMEASGETDIAGTAGMVGGALADPMAMVPVAGQAGKLAQGIGAAAKTGAKVGAGWGAAYGASEQLAEQGVPTTMEELKQTGQRVGEGAVVGAVAGGTLGVAAPVVGKAVKKVFGKPKTELLKTHQGKRKLGQKYYEEVWHNQINGDSPAQAATKAKKKFGLSMDEVHQIRLSLADDIDTYGVARDPTAKSSAVYSSAFDQRDAIERLARSRQLKYSDSILPSPTMRAVDRVIRPIDSRIRDVAPKVYKRLVDMEGNILKNVHNYHEQMVPYYKLHRQLSKAEREQVGLALYNGNFEQAKGIISSRFGSEGTQLFDNMISNLESLGAEMKSAGIKFDAIDNYFPRMIKDIDGLMDFFRKEMPGFDTLEQALEKARAKLGDRELTNAEQIKVINRWLENTLKSNKVKKSVQSAKQRKVQQITKDMLQFYDDPITSLDLHLRDSIAAIERRKFFGRHLVSNKSGIENITDSAGNYLKEAGANLDRKTTEDIKRMLAARFGKGEQAGSRLLATARQGVGGATLGNPYSAVRQLGDTFVVMWRNGFLDSMKALPRAIKETAYKEKGGLNADVMGYMMEMAQELDTGGVASNVVRKASEKLYRYGGFKTVDRFGKNMLMQSTLRQAQTQAKTPVGRKALVKKYGNIYTPDEMSQLLDDLSNNKMTDLVKSHIGAEVMDIQPISRSQLPEMYLNHPNGRALYQFRTWGLKQFDIVRTEIMRDIMSGDPARVRQGAKSLALMIGYVGGGNLAITELQRIMTGRVGVVEEESDIPEEAMWAFFGNLGADRYGLEKMAERGNPEEFLKGFLPPAVTIPAQTTVSGIKAASSIAAGEQADPITGKDPKVEAAREMLKTTGVGRLIDWLLLGGAEEFNEKEINKRLFGDIKSDE